MSIIPTLETTLSEAIKTQLLCDADYEEFKSAKVLLEALQVQMLRLSDWEALRCLKEIMVGHQIDHIKFGYDIDIFNDDANVLTVQLVYQQMGLKNFKENSVLENAIQNLFAYQLEERKPYNKIVWLKNFDAFAEEYMGSEEFAKKQRAILENTAQTTMVKKQSSIGRI